MSSWRYGNTLNVKIYQKYQENTAEIHWHNKYTCKNKGKEELNDGF